jgi:hypothetical protein
MTERKSKHPTHRIYAVRKISGDKDFWAEIGGAWQHLDERGFTLRFTLTPVGEADIVVRAINAPGGAQ